MRNWIVLSLLAVGMVACKRPKGDNPDEKRQFVDEMHDVTLNELYQRKPAAKAHVQNAPGYAVFNNLQTKFGIAASGHGYGVAVDNSTGKRTYMRMAEIGAGLGLGFKSFRAVFVFDDAKVLKRFVDKGWEFSAEGDAAAKSKTKGEAASGRSSAWNGVTIYQFTKTGLYLTANLMGTKYWKDKKLNAGQ